MKTHIFLPTALAVTLVSTTVHAGDGTYDPAAKCFDFGVSIQFHASAQQKALLETRFEKASAVLFDATDGQHQFRRVWCCNDGKGAKSADVLVQSGSGTSSAPGQFGIAGNHITLFYDSAAATFSAVDGSYTVAHEFGHFLYGVKDEYSGPTGIGKVCITPPADLSTQTACLMENYKQAGGLGAKLDEFCVASNHDPDSDTFQESSNHKSCWESILDRYAIAAPAGLPQAGPLTGATLFNWVESGGSHELVAVIDRSGSMSGTPISLAKEAGQLFVTLTGPTDHLGLASFSSAATADAPLTLMDVAGKSVVKSAVSSLSAGGNTNIGGGLLVAANMLAAVTDPGCLQAVLLLSDGAHNTGTNPAAVIPTLVAQNVRVYTVALGSGADTALMQSIAVQTKGKYFAASSSTELKSIFSQIAGDLGDGGVLSTGSGTLEPGEGVEEPVLVEEAATSASFVATTTGSADAVAISLRSPKGKTYDEASTGDVSVVVDGSSTTFLVTGGAIKAGTWKLRLESTEPKDGAIISYDYQAISNSSGVLFGAASDKLAYTFGQTMVLNATVSAGGPVTGVEVTGVVNRPDGSMVPVILRDDGSALAGDEAAADGIYSARFGQWIANGAYTVELDVVSGKKAKYVVGESIDDGGSKKKVPAFIRHTAFSATVSGVPLIDTENLVVDSLLLSASGKPTSNSLKLTGSLEVDMGIIQPEFDDLRIDVGGLSHLVDSDDLKKVGKKSRWVFKADGGAYSGVVDLFLKGSSKGHYSLKHKGQEVAFVGDFGTVSTRLRWGGFDELVTVQPKLKKSGSKASFKGDGGTVTPVFFVTAARVAPGKEGASKGKLTVRARLGGSFDPQSGPTTFVFGSFSVTIPAAEWDDGKNGAKLTYKDDIGGRKLKIVFVPELGELSVTASKLDFSEFPNPAFVQLTRGGYDEKTEIQLAAKKSTLTF